MSRRTEMIGSTIQKELALVILRELNDPRLTGMPSITRVQVSADLSTADVFITVMGTPGQQSAALHALRHSAGLMRSRLTKAMALRITPFLKFHIDEDLKKELSMLELLDKVAKETAENDARRAAAANPPLATPAVETSSVEIPSVEPSSAEQPAPPPTE